jgi:hypothetical protein
MRTLNNTMHTLALPRLSFLHQTKSYNRQRNLALGPVGYANEDAHPNGNRHEKLDVDAVGGLYGCKASIRPADRTVEFPVVHIQRYPINRLC